MSTANENDSARPPLLNNQDKAETEIPSEKIKDTDLLYTVEDVPPWYLSVILGFQHYLTMAGGTIAIPIIVSSFICMAEDDHSRGALVSTVFFHSGIATLLQTTFGVRLPIVQGADFAYTVPTIVLLTTVYEPCGALPLANMTTAQREEVWQERLRDVQGSIAVASIFQIVLGFSGIIGLLLPWITPLAIVPTISLVGLSLVEVASKQAGLHWGISSLTMILMVIFSQYLRNVALPFPAYHPKKGFWIARFQFFMCFPVLLAVFISWSLCWILTVTDTLPEGSPARTDLRSTLIENSPWIRIPYPGQWGTPTATVAGVVGMLSGATASIIESIGDYYACAKISGAPKPPMSAINRGIGTEGIGCVLAGLIGTGCGTTSCSQNIGAIGVTKIGSRRVIQYSAFILIATGIFGKIGAFFVTIPDPVVAGVFIVMFSMITAVGMSPLQYVSLNSPRNLFVLGYAIFLGLALPKWMESHPGAIQTGVVMMDQVLTVMLQTPMFVGGFIGFFLDNTVPGTAEERGLMQWNPDHEKEEDDENISKVKDNYQHSRCYDMPIGMPTIKRVRWFRYVPFSPTFTGFRRRKPSDEEM